MNVELEREDMLIVLAALNLSAERAPLSDDASQLRSYFEMRVALADHEAAHA